MSLRKPGGGSTSTAARKRAALRKRLSGAPASKSAVRKQQKNGSRKRHRGSVARSGEEAGHAKGPREASSTKDLDYDSGSSDSSDGGHVQSGAEWAQRFGGDAGPRFIGAGPSPPTNLSDRLPLCGSMRALPIRLYGDGKKAKAGDGVPVKWLWVKDHHTSPADVDPTLGPEAQAEVDARTLFVAGVAWDADADVVRSLFASFGTVESVKVGAVGDTASPQWGASPAVSRAWDTDVGEVSVSQHRGAWARVLFSTADAVKAVLGMSRAHALHIPSEGLNRVRGMQKWISEHRVGRIDVAAMQAEADAWMKAFDEEKAQQVAQDEDEPIVDEDGFVLVTRRRGHRHQSIGDGAHVAVAAAAPAGSDPQELSRGQRRKAKRAKILTDFYRFQRQESRAQVIARLRRQFEEDKRRIAKLKANRKFKPL